MISMFVSSCYTTGVVNNAGLSHSSGAPGVKFVLSVLFSFMCNGFVIYVSLDFRFPV